MGPTVLCIDDRPQVLELRKATLESHGYCANIASNGHTALKMLEVSCIKLHSQSEALSVELCGSAHSHRKVGRLPWHMNSLKSRPKPP